jgi:6-phosphofructokinase 1
VKSQPLSPGDDADDLHEIKMVQESLASRLARQVQVLTRTEVRVTALGHVQRGGEPSARDRLLATRLGTAAARLLAEGRYNVMVGDRDSKSVAVPLEEVAGVRNMVPLDHPWIRSARMVGTNLGVTDAELRRLIEEASG